MPPFGTDPAYSGLTTTQLASISVPVAGSYQFTYDTAGASELLKTQFPWGGYLRWTYASATYAGSRLLREIDNRYMYSQATSGGTEYGPYPFTHSDSGTTISTVHADTTLADASGVGAKKWTFTTSGSAWQIGLVSQFDQKTSASGTLITQDNYTWSQTATSSNPYISTKVSVKDPGTGAAASAETTQTLDQYGNATQMVVYPYNNTTTPLATYNSTFVTTSGYLANYVRGLLASASITVGGTTTTLMTNTYDGCVVTWLASPTNLFDVTPTSSSRGYMSSSATIAGTSTACVSAYGTPYSTTAPDGTTSYAALSSATDYTMPDSITTPTYSDALTYDYWLKATQTTGANGETMYMAYDSLGRPQTATSPYGTYGTPTVTYSYSSAGSLPAWQTQTGPNGFTRTTLDGFGRTVKVESGPNSSTIQSETDSVYMPCACSPLGKLQKTSMPYAPGGSPVWTQYTYDGIGRTLTVVLPDTASTTSYAYAGNQTTVTDPAGKWKTFTSDVSGNLTMVTEPDPANPTTLTFTTTYTYDWMNHLTGTSMTRSGTTQTRTFVYNSAGQLTSATNPENGTTSYTYNTDHTLQQTVDAKGQYTVYTYDSAKRVTQTQRYPLGLGSAEDVCQRVTYAYDYGTNGQGRLTSVVYGSPYSTSSISTCPGTANGYAYEEDYTYHAAGAMTGKTFTVTTNSSGGPYTTSASMSLAYTYDAAGRLATEKYPVLANMVSWAPTFTYSYDSMGRPSKMTDDNPNDPSGVGADWAKNASYDVAGRMTSLDMFAGVSWPVDQYTTETKTFNANGQLTSLGWGGGYGITYNFSATQNNGQITQEVQTLSGETISYAYDALKRLTSATSVNTSTSAAIWNQQFQYDGFGNLTGKGPTGSITSIPATASTNRLSSATYDANGNMTSGAGSSLTYDESNRLASATPLSGGTEYYGYAPDNKRIYRWTAAGNEEWTLYGAQGERIGMFTLDPGLPGTYQFDAQQTNVWFGGKLIGEINTSGAVQSVLRDRLGSRNPGNYKPYGEEKSTTANDKEKFATYLRDSFTGLDYADQRYYASGYGRFNTVDRGSPNSKDPVSWNRYSYTGGDPVNRIDPHGMCWFDSVGDWGEDVDTYWNAGYGGYGQPIDPRYASYYIGICWQDPMAPLACFQAQNSSGCGGGGGGDSVEVTQEGTGGNGGGDRGAVLAEQAIATFATFDFSPQCNDFLSNAFPGAGINGNVLGELQGVASNVALIDAATVNTAVGSTLFPGNPALAAAQQARADSSTGIQGSTISQWFARRTTIQAASQYNGNEIFYNDATFASFGSGYAMYTMFHEMLHIVGLGGDAAIEKAFGISEATVRSLGSGAITTKLAAECGQ